jgi:hypothetical protein
MDRDIRHLGGRWRCHRADQHGQTDYRFPLAIYQAILAGNVDVTIRFKPVAGKVDQAGGIAVRLSDPDNYYVVRANALEDNVRFYRVVKGQRMQIAGANTKVTANEWHQLGLRAEGRGSRSPLTANNCSPRPTDHRERRQGRALDQGRQCNALRWHRNPDAAVTTGWNDCGRSTTEAHPRRIA